MRGGILILFMGVLILEGCSAPTAIVTRRHDREGSPRVENRDGFTGNMEFDQRTGFYYSFEYDNEYLFVRMATANRELKNKIVYFGLNVWIDRSGGRVREQGFGYPTGVSMIGQSDERRRSVSSIGYRPGTLEKMLERANEINLAGIYGTSSRTVKLRDSRIIVRAAVVEDTLIYEARVPYSMLSYGFNPLSGRSSLSIGFETGNFDPPAVPRRQAGTEDMRPGGRMTPTGGMRGQVPGRMADRAQPQTRSSDMAGLTRPTRLWINLEFDRSGLLNY